VGPTGVRPYRDLRYGMVDELRYKALEGVDREARRFSSVLFLLSIVLKRKEMIVGLVGVHPEVDVKCFVMSSKERDIADSISLVQTKI
jgi:hypothetical protein